MAFQAARSRRDRPTAISESTSSSSHHSETAKDKTTAVQLALLSRLYTDEESSELSSAPLFSYPILSHTNTTNTKTKTYTQYGLLGGSLEYPDPRVYYNVATPSSAFICGSQGSGKSHTLSCLLENCLIPSDALGRLPRPLAAIVFHYDDYASDSRVAPCEAAYLASDPAVSVRVLCAPTNVRVIKESYAPLKNVKVEALQLDEAHLNTKRMLELMAFDKNQPLYAQVIQRILRDMRLAQQQQQGRGAQFHYLTFKNALAAEQLMTEQSKALRQRLDTLQSFLVQSQVDPKAAGKKTKGTDWTLKAGELIIVDLTCPCITAPMACALFNICLSVFLGQDSSIGRVIALDEAHRYMGDSNECETFTNSLLAAIRMQRHVGARIIVSTQEPTISPKLLDLCSITIVHRFTSPDWLSALSKHLAGMSKLSRVTQIAEGDVQMPITQKLEGLSLNSDANGRPGSGSGSNVVSSSDHDRLLQLFAEIVKLRPGEALVFAPNAVLSLETKQKMTVNGVTSKLVPVKLAHNVLRLMMRKRLTEDGGRSVMAS
ncbi:hypothetical protein F5Y17DRAFT_441937 [Xylariaceae sp. FL0594]|nr:hypothetical protein F5Y17DRAFT_441937 [Xylariaceae sp. FL0594]